MATKKTEEVVEIKALNNKEVKVRIIGDTPLIVHAWSDKAKRMMLEAQQKATKTKAKEIREKHPERMIKDAVWGMMPHGRLGRAQFAKLKVYAGAEHPHAAQNPTKITME